MRVVDVGCSWESEEGWVGEEELFVLCPSLREREGRGQVETTVDRAGKAPREYQEAPARTGDQLPFYLTHPKYSLCLGRKHSEQSEAARLQAGLGDADGARLGEARGAGRRERARVGRLVSEPDRPIVVASEATSR